MKTGGKFAVDTDVPVAKSRMEIEALLVKYGASRFGYLAEDARAAVQFSLGGRTVRIVLPLPSEHSDEVKRKHIGNGTYGPRPYDEIPKRLEQVSRSRWRALLLVLKAKLEAIEVGIATIEDEFLAYTVLPNGQTFGEWARPQLNAIDAGKMPSMIALTGGQA